MTISIHIECPTWMKAAAKIVAPLLLVGTAGAAFSVPNTFSPGQTIKAADMNANFAALESEISALQTAVQAAKIPPGTVAYYAAKTCPSGWLEANGATVSSVTYPDLYAVIGDTFGGTTLNFALPQLDGEFIRGWDNGRGVDVGRAFGSFEYGSSIALDGYANGSPGFATASGFQDRMGWNNQFDEGFQGNVAPGTAINGVTVPPANDTAHATSVISASTAGTVNGYDMFVGARPRNVALLPCIKV